MARRNMERWRDAAKALGEPRMSALAEDGEGKRLLDAIFGNSPYLSHILVNEPQILLTLLASGPDALFASLLGSLREEAAGATEITALMRLLRIAKRRCALLVAVADITGAWSLDPVTAALSALAETALSLGAAFLLKRAHDAGDLVLPYPGEPERESGLVVLGMGKLGGRELNYSSDIDIIIFYDDEKVDYRGRRSVQELFIRMARDLVRIMDERTVEGYVFRTDLRLRPDPGSTPAAISLVAAEIYYESFGQNWERAAMIKARQMAGDRRAGRDFLQSLRPFLWRKNLDFAAIRDIHAIKRQINAHKGGGRIAVAGHNIKLGRGGIREIEFFVQTQQLIWGGREPAMRTARTCDALAALASAGHIQPGAAGELTRAYHYLRRLEHRLQMIDDHQTQTLPEDPDRLTALAVFMCYADSSGFAAELTGVLRCVESHYAKLFEDSPPLAPTGNLMFTGGESDPETLKTIAAMGFSNAPVVDHQIRAWHHGRVRATRSTRARELMTELTPSLLEALARTAEPHAAFMRFDAFLARLPAGVPLFALFHANPSLLDLVAEIMGDAPRLAEHLARNTNLLDGVLTQGFLDPPGPADSLAAELNRALDQSGDDLQEMLNISRRWVNEQKFRVGIQTLHTMLEPAQAAHHLSDIADAALMAVQPRIEAEFILRHGRFPGPGAALLAMGKMGSREMTASSDLDLILVYDVPGGVELSDGPKPLSPSAYFGRLTQRIINAITAKTGEGALYEVDMRLRPSGNAGPIATSLLSFAQYHETMAWTWEHLALTRARVITGSPVLQAGIRAVIDQTLRREREPRKLLADVADMRRRMAREHKADSIWDVKHLRGGLVDIEFIAQYLQLRHAHDHPGILHPSTAQALEAAVRLGLLAEADGELLQDALRLFSAVQQVLRQTIEGRFSAEQAPGRLREVLVRATASTHFDGLMLSMAERAKQVHALFDRVIDPSAEKDFHHDHP